MKKIALFILVLLLCGCGKDNNVQDEPKDVTTTASCSTTMETMGDMTFDLAATNDKIDKIKMTVVPDNSSMGIESFENLDDDMKAQIEDLFLQNLGVTEDNQGIIVSVNFTENMIITLDFDLNTADQEILEKFGFDFSEDDMSLKSSVKEMEESGFTCK